MQTLPIRPTRSSIAQAIAPSAYPRELAIDAAQETEGLPWLHGELGIQADTNLTLVLRVHNSAGIPIIEADSSVAAGQRRFTFRHLRPLGIEAYAHAAEHERIRVAQRIWSRRVYGTLSLVASR